MRPLVQFFLLSLAWVLAADPARAAPCETGDFDGWVETFKREAAGKGISQRTLEAAFAEVTYDPRVVSLDRRQGVFKQSVEQFADRMISPGRMQKATTMLREHAGLFARIEQQYGVPGAVIVAIWAMETDFGVNQGKHPAIRALATLAYDCRRSAMFQGELTEALRIIDRGDLSLAEMRGAWAGELGQTQFLPSSYVKYAVDFDGNGRRDLIRSVPDVLGSTANYLHGYGWRRGQPWHEGTANFEVLRQWNKAQVYAKTIALFATRLSGGE
jgi:lytic murein transglycosylase